VIDITLRCVTHIEGEREAKYNDEESFLVYVEGKNCEVIA